MLPGLGGGGGRGLQNQVRVGAGGVGGSLGGWLAFVWHMAPSPFPAHYHANHMHHGHGWSLGGPW